MGSILLLYPLHWIFYVTGAMGLILLIPVYRVSIHVLDLVSMEKMKKVNNSIYEGVLYRNFILLIGRFFSLFLLYIATFITSNEYIVIVFGMIMILFAYVLTALYAKKI